MLTQSKDMAEKQNPSVPGTCPLDIQNYENFVLEFPGYPEAEFFEYKY